MFRLNILLLIFLLPSCFLFPKFRKDQFAYTERGRTVYAGLVVPKGFSRVEKAKDSAGNEVQTFYYPGGARLYYVHASDTSIRYQPFDYSENIPREIYGAPYVKGRDSSGHYWRESRFKNFIAGYQAASDDYDWRFDSSINYFTLHLPRQ